MAFCIEGDPRPGLAERLDHPAKDFLGGRVPVSFLGNNQPQSARDHFFGLREAKPDQCTLVPDDPAQFTSDHGWDATKDGDRLGPVIEELKTMGIRVSLFMDPDLAQIERIATLKPDRIELYTEPYAAAFGSAQQESSWQCYNDASRLAQQLGMGVNAGHDLNLYNLPHFVAIPGILECSIGHALIADALTYGLPATIGKYLQAIRGEQPELDNE